MEHVKFIEIRKGVDVGYHNSNLYTADRIGCVGKHGINKNFTLDEMIKMAYTMVEKPNIIIKAGPNAKWYLKSFPVDVIEREIEKQNWRDVSRCTMYIIEWDK